MSEQETLIYVSLGWALCVVLYYFAGKKLGYAGGYKDGIKDGHTQVLAAMNTTSDIIQDNTP